MIFSHLHFSGTFRWTSDKDYTLVKEVRFLEPYLYKSGSKLAGQKWTEVADKGFTKFMNDIFHTMTVDKGFNRSSLLVLFFRAKRLVLDPIHHRQEPDLSCSSNRSHSTVVLNLKFPIYKRWLCEESLNIPLLATHFNIF